MLQITWGMQISPGKKKKSTKKVTGKKRRAENETLDMKKTKWNSLMPPRNGEREWGQKRNQWNVTDNGQQTQKLREDSV